MGASVSVLTTPATCRKKQTNKTKQQEPRKRNGTHTHIQQEREREKREGQTGYMRNSRVVDWPGGCMCTSTRTFGRPIIFNTTKEGTESAHTSLEVAKKRALYGVIGVVPSQVRCSNSSVHGPNTPAVNRQRTPPPPPPHWQHIPHSKTKQWTTKHKTDCELFNKFIPRSPSPFGYCSIAVDVVFFFKEFF